MLPTFGGVGGQALGQNCHIGSACIAGGISCCSAVSVNTAYVHVAELCCHVGDMHKNGADMSNHACDMPVSGGWVSGNNVDCVVRPVKWQRSIFDEWCIHVQEHTEANSMYVVLLNIFRRHKDN